MKGLRQIRERTGLSQAEAARRIGISRQAYGNYELGKRQADYETLLKLGELFDVSVEELISESNESKIIAEIQKIKQNAPDDEVRSEIMKMISGLSDEQAKQLRDFLKGLIPE
jgi:transcriptional regulator with XRE-family HTH domain